MVAATRYGTTSVLPIQDEGITHLGVVSTIKTDSLVGRASVMLASDASSIPAQSTIFMTFLQKSVMLRMLLSSPLSVFFTYIR